MYGLNWSAAEKKIARQAFDRALNKERAAILAQLKQRASQAADTGDLWEIHDYLSDQRKQLDRKYDYRYSQLIWVFGQLLYEQWLEEGDLTGLAPEKLQAIRDFVATRRR
ncbi:MAG: hypothetical protein U1F63_05235 [Chitinivorax sp.]